MLSIADKIVQSLKENGCKIAFVETITGGGTRKALIYIYEP